MQPCRNLCRAGQGPGEIWITKDLRKSLGVKFSSVVNTVPLKLAWGARQESGIFNDTQSEDGFRTPAGGQWYCPSVFSLGGCSMDAIRRAIRLGLTPPTLSACSGVSSGWGPGKEASNRGFEGYARIHAVMKSRRQRNRFLRIRPQRKYFRQSVDSGGRNTLRVR